MNYNELNEIIDRLSLISHELEFTYIDNGGEVTEETETMEAEKAALQQLLASPEGVDMLGRWLKGKQDKEKALKAEKEYIDRQIKANAESMERVKAKATLVLQMAGVEKASGNLGYSFTQTTSVKTEVDKDTLKALFLEKVEAKLRGGKTPVIPADVTITLGASVKAVPEGAELPVYYLRNENPTVTFRKPKAAKED